MLGFLIFCFKNLFPELIQYDLTPDSIGNSYLKMFSMPEQYQSHLLEINDAMSGKGFDNAAKAIKFIVIIAGVDEVGRGCLAGPVTAATVILNYHILD